MRTRVTKRNFSIFEMYVDLTLLDCTKIVNGNCIQTTENVGLEFKSV